MCCSDGQKVTEIKIEICSMPHTKKNPVTADWVKVYFVIKLERLESFPDGLPSRINMKNFVQILNTIP